MKKTMKKSAVFLLCIAAIGTAFAASSCASASNRESSKKAILVLLPFDGGNEGDGEAFVSSLARQDSLRKAFNETILHTPSTLRALNLETEFQRTTGLPIRIQFLNWASFLMQAMLWQVILPDSKQKNSSLSRFLM